jgi:hypothetical protein
MTRASEKSPDVKDEAMRAATAYISRSDVPRPIREAMLTLLRQHPDDVHWSGRNGHVIFAIAVKSLPRGKAGERAASAMLSLAHVLAVQELLKGKFLLDRYATHGLTDAATLRDAVVLAAGSLSISGTVNGVVHQTVIQSGFAIGYVLTEEEAIVAHLFQPAELAKVSAAYREVMHRQVRELMKRSNWKDALLLWQHLHKRNLASPQLDLDAARCFKELGQDTDALRVLDEAIGTLGKHASAEFLERAGDLAIGIPTEQGQALAEKAYLAASLKLRDTISLPEANLPE